MKKEITATRILLCVGIVVALIGTFICTTSPDNVFLGIAVIAVGALCFLLALIPTFRLLLQRKQMQNKT
jgi:membrane protein YdbS with pleckstrin-like domain